MEENEIFGQYENVQEKTEENLSFLKIHERNLRKI